MEEPFGRFGAMNPTGHAAIYLDRVCAETPTRLRTCRPGELGVVISRYHRVNGYDWVAVPLVPYLYAVDTTVEIPEKVSPSFVKILRDRYRRENLLDIAPNEADGGAPGGEWVQLVGSSYDRKIYGFRLRTTAAQEEELIARLNDRTNRGHFNLLFHNCADFSRSLLNLLYPDMVRRNFVADFGLTTPKQAAKTVVEYGERHPEVVLEPFVIPQVPGTVERSRPIRGIAESLVRQKRYLVPLTILHPELTGGLLVAYLAEGRFKMPANVEVFSLVQPDDCDADCVAAEDETAGNER